jgi:hypothetical protein
MVDQRDLESLVMNSLGRHRRQFPPDQLDPLVLVHDPGGDHRLDLGDSKSTAGQAFGGLGAAGMESDVHRARLLLERTLLLATTNGSGFPENRAEAPRFGRRRSGRQSGGRLSLLFRGDDRRMLSRSRCSTGSSINSPNPMCKIEHLMIGIDPCLCERKG